MKIAFLSCPETLPTSSKRRPDAFEHDLQINAIRQGMNDRALVLEVDWHAPLEGLAGFNLAILGTAWDYVDEKNAFLCKLEQMTAHGIQVRNPLEVVRWNADKSYLAELERAGAPSIPTLWSEAPDARAVAKAFDHFDCDRIVVKRAVGSGGIGQSLIRKSDPLAEDWHMDVPALLQPFLPKIQSEGEYSFIFIEGALSHALIKKAKAGEYRIQSLYGGSEFALKPQAADIEAAQAIMALLPFAEPPLYARIDMVRREDGVLSVIEAELIEPFLYPVQGEGFGRMMADAILRCAR